jgi:chromosome segregation ATPase
MTEANTPQGTGEQSMEDRLAGILGDDFSDGMVDHTKPKDDDEPQEAGNEDYSEDDPSPSEDTPETEPVEDAPEAKDPDEAEPETYTVTVNGEQIEVTREELLKGYSRQADYTRKTNEVAQTRQQLQHEMQQVGLVKQQLLGTYQALVQQQGQEPDWDTLRREDPYEFQQKAAEWTVIERQKQNLEAQIAQANQVQQRQVAQQEAEYLQGQEQRLLALKPEWKVPEVRAKETQAIVAYLTNDMGLTPDEVNFVSKGDARYIAAVDKARKWDALQKQKPHAQAKAKGKPPVKPGVAATKASRQADTLQAARGRLRRTGSVKDAANAMSALLGKDLD